MANEKQLIRVLTEPTIVLDDINSTDAESGTSDSTGKPTSAVKYSKQQGGVYPLIQILSKTFESEQVVSLEIDSSGTTPFISVNLLIKDKSFYSSAFPKDGDLMSIFIRSKDDLFKPIRNDYDITNISINSREGGGENSYDTMSIFGTLRVPGYDAKKCFSKKGTSFTTLMETATDLNLGFATNEVDTNDEQVWICPFDKTRDFIDETTLAAWKDTNSFFTSYIDPFYYLNFVNVEPQFSDETEIEEAMLIDLLTNDYGKDSEQGKVSTKSVLTNWEESSGSAFYMLNHSLVNNASGINLTYGYKRYVQYYDALLKESQNVFIDPLTTDGAERDKILLKGRPNEDFYLQQFESKWMGTQYGTNGENCHEKYNIARVQNFQNLVHLDKMGLKVTLQSINPNLRRMQSVPVVIVIKRDAVRKIINEPEDESQQASIPNESEPNRTKSALDANESPITIDKTISGFYVISGIKYIYRKGEFRQELNLVRREWPTPPATH